MEHPFVIFRLKVLIFGSKNNFPKIKKSQLS